MAQTDAASEPIRVEELRRLAEQAMSDPVFRADARGDLAGALIRHGYRLNDRELALVLRFRDSLAEAGVDLDLVDQVKPEDLEALLVKLDRR